MLGGTLKCLSRESHLIQPRGGPRLLPPIWSRLARSLSSIAANSRVGLPLGVEGIDQKITPHNCFFTCGQRRKISRAVRLLIVVTSLVTL